MAKLFPILLVAPLALTGLSLPAAAQERQSVVVRYDDLNLSSASGRERLTTRVRMAVLQVCGARDTRDLKAKAQAATCKKAAMRDADVKLAGLFSGNGTALADRGTVYVSAP
jgi:UrcA family protein